MCKGKRSFVLAGLQFALSIYFTIIANNCLTAGEHISFFVTLIALLASVGIVFSSIYDGLKFLLDKE